MVLIGIMAIVAIPAFSRSSDFRGLEFRDKTVAALRFAQKTATSHRRLVCVSFTASTVTLSIAETNGGSSCNLPLQLPWVDSQTLVSGDANNAVFAAVPDAINFKPDGTATNATITVLNQSPIQLVGKTGYVQ